MVSAAQHACGLVFVERHRALELVRADRRVDLGRVDPSVAEKGSTEEGGSGSISHAPFGYDACAMIERNTLEWLRSHLLDNDVVLFLGAGFSGEAINVLGAPLPSSRELAHQLYEFAGFHTKQPFNTRGLTRFSSLLAGC
jgi:hypothetical protein